MVPCGDCGGVCGTYLSTEDVSDPHFMVVHDRSQMISWEQVGFQQYWVSRQRGMRVLELPKHKICS